MNDRLTTPERMTGLIMGGDIDRVPVLCFMLLL